MKFSSQIWSVILSLYRFKKISKTYILQLSFERNFNIPKLFLKFRYFYLHNGRAIRYILLNDYRAGMRFGKYLLTRALATKKKKKKKMGQKGKFLSQRAGYANLWHDLWYTYKNYHSIYFQNYLIREFITHLMLVGFSTINLFILPTKKTSNLLNINFLKTSEYLAKFKTDFNYIIWGKEFLRQLRGIYLTKLHIIKFFSYIFISGAGYKWRKRRSRNKRLYKAEQRISLFYSSLLLLENAKLSI